jgi:hypothetical protein
MDHQDQVDHQVLQDQVDLTVLVVPLDRQVPRDQVDLTDLLDQVVLLVVQDQTDLVVHRVLVVLMA